MLTVPTFPDVPLVVPGLHPDPAAEAERLEGGEAGLGAEVVMADQDADLRKGVNLLILIINYSQCRFADNMSYKGCSPVSITMSQHHSSHMPHNIIKISNVTVIFRHLEEEQR